MKSRKDYTKPTVKKVKLALTDSLLAGCKTGTTSDAGGPGDVCQVATGQCKVS